MAKVLMRLVRVALFVAALWLAIIFVSPHIDDSGLEGSPTLEVSSTHPGKAYVEWRSVNEGSYNLRFACAVTDETSREIKITRYEMPELPFLTPYGDTNRCVLIRYSELNGGDYSVRFVGNSGKLLELGTLHVPLKTQ
jgi:hypothetical protein